MLGGSWTGKSAGERSAACLRPNDQRSGRGGLRPVRADSSRTNTPRSSVAPWLQCRCYGRRASRCRTGDSQGHVPAALGAVEQPLQRRNFCKANRGTAWLRALRWCRAKPAGRSGMSDTDHWRGAGPMTDRIALMLEAERRGILPPTRQHCLRRRAPTRACARTDKGRFQQRLCRHHGSKSVGLRTTARLAPSPMRLMPPSQARSMPPMPAIAILRKRPSTRRREAAQQQRLKAQFDAMPAPLRYSIGAGASLDRSARNRPRGLRGRRTSSTRKAPSPD